jgi:hypothetical protein
MSDGFGFPITAITRDHGDSGDLPEVGSLAGLRDFTKNV